MFIKLLKHDMLVSFKKRLILVACSVGAAALGIVFALISSSAGTADESMLLLNEAALSISVLATSVSALLMSIGVYIDFFRGLYSPEGQLAFTRPVSRGAVLLSKTLSGAVWMSVTNLASFGSIAAFYIGSSYSEEIVAETMGSGLMEIIAASAETYVPLLLAFGLTSAIMELTAAQLAITFGALIPRRSKALCGVGIYLAATAVTQILTDIATTPLSIAVGEVTPEGVLIPEAAAATYSLWVMIVSIAVNVCFSIGAYFISRLIINKKLSFR